MRATPTDLERIRHMIRAAEKIFSYTETIDFDAFLSSELIQDAVIKNFEVIGEAAYKITSTFKEKHDTIEWSKIQGLRHVLVHDYYMVNPEILWNTKEKHLHNLLLALENIAEQY